MRPFHPPNEVNSGRDVAPLVRATRLQRAPVASIELDIVVGLQELVAELGVGDAILRQTCCDRLSIQHAVDAEVLAHVAKELQDTHACSPVKVVHRHGRVGTVEVIEAIQLLSDARDPCLHDFCGVQRSLTALLGVPNQSRGTAHEREWPMPVLLEPPHCQDLDEVAQMETRGSRVKPAIERDGPTIRGCAERI